MTSTMVPKRTLSVEQIDLSDLLGFWTMPLDEREGAFSVLREQRPIARFTEPEFGAFPAGPGYWAVTRHADVLAVSRDPATFCSGNGATSIADLPTEFNEFFGSMINMDDPRHARLRRIVSRGFTPRMLAKLQDGVESAAADIISSVREKGRIDFVTEVAAELPLRIICDMMGIPDSDYRFVFDRSNVILGAGDPEYVPEGSDPITALLTAGGELDAMVKELGALRRRKPTDDLTSMLVNAEVDGEKLTDQELGSFFVLLVVAGNETTRNAISHGLWALSQNPDQRRIWQDQFDAVAPTAVEEIVRWASPVVFMRRTATKDTTVGGQDIAEGDKLVLFYWSANRDEAVFENPYTFDVRRTPNDHVGFGGPGPHFCLGAHLARREITVMFKELFTHLPDITAAGEPERLRSNFINGIKHLPAEFTPA